MVNGLYLPQAAGILCPFTENIISFKCGAAEKTRKTPKLYFYFVLVSEAVAATTVNWNLFLAALTEIYICDGVLLWALCICWRKLFGLHSAGL